MTNIPFIFFFSLKPDVERYCLRCCKNKKDCPTHMPTKGCVKVIGGNYV